MTTPEKKYKVQSLERGLAILRELRTTDVPVRNLDLVSRTGLPKATVSRLLSTLGALGYVRRIDRGSYVLANASARSGRAMLASLNLDRFRGMFSNVPGPVYLEALVAARWLPVYRWSRTTAATVVDAAPLAIRDNGAAAVAGDGEFWDAGAGTWWAWFRMHMEGVGDFALTTQVARDAEPSAQLRADACSVLQHAARTLAGAKEQ